MAEPIRQPRNRRLSPEQKALKMEAALVWKQTFGRERTQQFNTAQKFVDSECIRRCVPYTPARNNILYKTATLGTKIGSGHIYYQDPKARYQYYGVLMVSSRTGSPWARHGEKKVIAVPRRYLNYDKTRHPRACRLWFEVMKKNDLPAIGRGVARLTGGQVVFRKRII